MSIGLFNIQKLIKTCEKNKDLSLCRRLHFLMVSFGLDSASIFGDHLIRLLGFCGGLFEANLIFSRIQQPSVFTWQAIMSCHFQQGEFDIVLDLYAKMWQHGIQADKVTHLCALQACGNMGLHTHAKILYDHSIQCMHDSDVKVGNATVDMFAKCQSLPDASKVFETLPCKTVVSWTAIIDANVQYGHSVKALEYFSRMKHHGMNPDDFTYTAVLKACAVLNDAGNQGRCMHQLITCCENVISVAIGTALIDMYTRCKKLEEACHVFNAMSYRNVTAYNAMISGHFQQGKLQCASHLFERMEQDNVRRNVVTWNAMISGYVMQEMGLHAMKIYEQMRIICVEPDIATFLSLLKACSSLGNLSYGRMIHDNIVKRGMDSDVVVGNTLIDMYAKCSCLLESFKILSGLVVRTTVSWGALIGAYTQHGFQDLALKCFECMEDEGVIPIHDTYSSILVACQHFGQIEKGYHYFKSMAARHGVQQEIEHFNSMVDLLGRAGRPHEAAEMLRTMPHLPKIMGWMSLLTACRKFENVNLGQMCFDEALHLDPAIGSGYAGMLIIYGNDNRWKEGFEIRRQETTSNVMTIPGISWMEADKFSMDSKTQIHQNKICDEINRRKMLSTDSRHVEQQLHDPPEDDSERLSLVSPLLCIPRNTTERIEASHTFCSYSHSVIKMISDTRNRKIILRAKINLRIVCALVINSLHGYK